MHQTRVQRGSCSRMLIFFAAFLLYNIFLGPLLHERYSWYWFFDPAKDENHPHRMACNVDVAHAPRPLVLVQYGASRSGSTFQTMLLCAILLLKSNFSASYSCTYTSGSALRVDTRLDFIVLKYHKGLSPRTLAQAYSFATVVKDEVDVVSERRYCHVQRVSQLTHEVTADLVAEYAPFFNLSQAEVFELSIFLRLWGILRQCCSVQASAGHMMALGGGDDGVSSSLVGYGKSWLSHSESLRQFRGSGFGLDECALYNLSAVERSLFQTRIRQAMQRLHSLNRYHENVYWKTRIGLCAEINTLISKEGWKFNDRRFISHFADDDV